MNRIREIRLAKGLSQAELARRMNSTQATVQRLESGERQLTEFWMRELAKALDVRPMDIIAIVTEADFHEELEAVSASNGLMGPLAKLGMRPCILIADSVCLTGYKQGETYLINQQVKREDLKTGDVVALRVGDEKGVTIVRQYIAPGLVTTNRPGTNIAMQLSDPYVRLELIGTLVKGD